MLRLLDAEVELSDTYPFRGEVALDAVPLSELLRIVPVFLDRERASWTMAGSATLEGALTDWSTLSYRARVDSIEARLPDASSRADGFEIDGDLEQIRVSGFEMRGTRNHIRLDGVIPLGGDARFDVETSAAIELDVFEILVPELEITGRGHRRRCPEWDARRPGPRRPPPRREQLGLVEGHRMDQPQRLGDG